MNPHCRISTIRHKDAPHIVEVVPKPRGLDNILSLERNAKFIIEALGGDCAGYAIVAWDFSGNFTRATRMHEDCFITETFIPDFVAAVLRRDVAADVAEEVLHGEL